MMSCPTWGDALRLARHYHTVASSLCNIDIEVDEEKQTLTYVATPFYQDMVDREPFTVEKLFASLIAITKPLLAEPEYPTKVSFAYPEPNYSKSYHNLFKCPIEFNAPGKRFELDFKVQQQPILLANSISAEIGRKMCAEFMSRQALENQEMTREVTAGHTWTNAEHGGCCMQIKYGQSHTTPQPACRKHDLSGDRRPVAP
jgi:hypothetical protein